MPPHERDKNALRCVVLALVGAWLSACGGAADSPEEVFHAFASAMAASGADEARLEEAYALLAAPSRSVLRARAAQATQLAGRDVPPWEMLVPGRFTPRFVLRPYGGVRARVEGDRAVLTLRGREEREQAEVHLVREAGAWRLLLGLPGEAKPE